MRQVPARSPLNYVTPEARFRGISKAILRSLEAYLRDLVHTECRLTSTETAHAFYLAMGYGDAGEPDLRRSVSGRPMHKLL
ncbi:GNAT family N-acetyltransferase [Pleomorphomonas diazotrophica]|uniref:GNAT family N-acetyltransferase n=1 Tax=Pleomorphomonas diazotrophica TaxID=1166257 RepID=UPI001FCE87F4|nr:GNAT family N-acetyltransferase [Pleomorphomonas diazotrophica]